MKIKRNNLASGARMRERLEQCSPAGPSKCIVQQRIFVQQNCFNCAPMFSDVHGEYETAARAPGAAAQTSAAFATTANDFSVLLQE